MYETIARFDVFLFIRFEEECLIISNGTLKRAKNRYIKKSRIRKSVTASIDQEGYVFTKIEWERAKEFALTFQIKSNQRDIVKLIRWESKERFYILKLQQKKRAIYKNQIFVFLHNL